MVSIDTLNKIVLEMYGEMNPSLYNTLQCPMRDLTDFHKSLLKGVLNVRSNKTLLKAISKYLQKDTHHIRVLGQDKGVEGFILYEEKDDVITNAAIFIDNGKPIMNITVAAYLKTFFLQTSYDNVNWRVSVFHPLKEAFKEVCCVFGGTWSEDEEFVNLIFKNIYRFDLA